MKILQEKENLQFTISKNLRGFNFAIWLFANISRGGQKSRKPRKFLRLR